MKRLLCFAILCTLATFVACKKDEDEYNPYPVWILNAFAVVDSSEIGIPEAPVNGCPQAIFYVLPNGSDSTVNCFEHSNRVKVWNHIDSVVTIEYYLHCDGYFDSDPQTVTFRVEDAYQRPGRDGPEVEVNQTVIMEPQ